MPADRFLLHAHLEATNACLTSDGDPACLALYRATPSTLDVLTTGPLFAGLLPAQFGLPQLHMARCLTKTRIRPLSPEDSARAHFPFQARYGNSSSTPSSRRLARTPWQLFFQGQKTGVGAEAWLFFGRAMLPPSSCVVFV